MISIILKTSKEMDMSELNITIWRTLRIWWALTWRTLVFCFGGGMVVGFIVGFVMGLSGQSKEAVHQTCTLLGMLVALPAGLWALKATLTKRSFGDFRIALIRIEESGETVQPATAPAAPRPAPMPVVQRNSDQPFGMRGRPK